MVGSLPLIYFDFPVSKSDGRCDIHSISLLGLLIVAIELSIPRAWFIRMEVVVLMVPTFLWDAWAIQQFLDRRYQAIVI